MINLNDNLDNLGKFCFHTDGYRNNIVTASLSVCDLAG